MKSLKSLLREVQDGMDALGDGLSAKAVAQLAPYRRKQFVIFVIFEVLAIACVAGCVWYVIANPLDTARAKMIAGLLGIGSGGGLEIARRAWKEWARTDLALLLLSEATEAQVKTLVDRLVKTL